jgi:hypothetical protein
VPALPARTPHVNHGGDAPDRPHSAAAASAHDAVRGGGQRHPSFPQGLIANFDFLYQGSNWMGEGPPPGGTACVPPPGGHVRFAPSYIDTSNDMVLGGRITTPCFTDRSHVARAKNISKFDLAGLAESKYHIGEMGVEVLTP